MNFYCRLRPIVASCVMAVAIVPIVSAPAFAQAAGIETILQNIVDLLTGNIFRLLATIAVIVIAIAWMFGYMDLRRAGYWIIGIGIIAGSSELVGTIVGS
ncbi:Type IV secretory pathway AvhB2 protein [Brucella anthropi]|uniref:TrbC/VIRB2 family protein n=1 Tax=Brucella lupini TaxID=255457 RepID=A0A256H007_9HYPH|nr:MULTISPECIES: TrbC/VirB2 family protein [Brucella]KAB2701707.1 Type IV secretory pathway AvhB2 protein [Brucella lupini]KAB2786130.1 Type IV secretory pathway AvhB2 protein [Brucella anthropi]OYR32578.1 trbC/VIRB2 family protein [Brucella lupini]UVV68174.1 TrbC/VirB2 family protein [Brucella anthropi]